MRGISEKRPRQRPTFALWTIIGPGGLNGRVRNGNGCVSAGMITWEWYDVERTAGLLGEVRRCLWQRHNHGTHQHDHNDSDSISTGQLNAFRYTRLHLRPINLVVFQGIHRENSSWRGLHA